jgi:hypothetical protein
VQHDYVSLAVVVSKKTDVFLGKAFAMYLFMQFYKEFTPDLLKDFYQHDKLEDDTEKGFINVHD